MAADVQPNSVASRRMAAVRQKGTDPEIRVRRLAHALGFRYRLHRRDLPGTPDLVFPRLRKAILVHGCFWHRHPNCGRATMPKTRMDFWSKKFSDNVARDEATFEKLTSLGWKILVVWECETMDGDALEKRLASFLRN